MTSGTGSCEVCQSVDLGKDLASGQRTKLNDRLGDLLILVSVAAAAVFARFSLSPLQEMVRSALGLTDNQLAILQGPALAVPTVLAAIPLGFLVDRRSRVRILFWLTVVDLAGGIVSIFAHGFVVLIAGRVLLGVGVPAISTAALSLIGDLYAPALRGRALTAVAIGQYGALSLVFGLGGGLAGLYESSTEGWRWALTWLNVPLIPILFLSWRMREPSRGDGFKISAVRNSEWSRLWLYRRVLSTIITGLVMGDMAVFAVLTWAASAFSRSFQIPPAKIGALVGTATLVSGLLGPVVGGVVADATQRFGGARRTVWALCAIALIGAPAGLFAVVPSVNGAAALLTVFSVMGGAILVAGGALLTVVVPSDLRGVAVSFSNTIQTLLGIGFVPLAISTLANLLGGPGMLGRALSWVCVAAPLIAASVFALGARHFDATAIRSGTAH